MTPTVVVVLILMLGWVAVDEEPKQEDESSVQNSLYLCVGYCNNQSQEAPELEVDTQ